MLPKRSLPQATTRKEFQVNLSKNHSFFAILIPCFFVLLSLNAWGAVTGSVSGTVRDPDGSVVPGANVIVQELSKGLVYRTVTDGHGSYTLPALPVGRYRLDVQAPGFRGYQRKEIVLDTNAALTLNATLAVGSTSETVSVNDDTLHVETIETQLGEVISGRQMTAVPLDGRSFTDLLSLQAGVAPASSITSSTVQDVGATTLAPSGTLNPGTVSVNGQREFANYFGVNGSDVEEDVNAGTAIIPNECRDGDCAQPGLDSRVPDCDEQL